MNRVASNICASFDGTMHSIPAKCQCGGQCRGGGRGSDLDPGIAHAASAVRCGRCGQCHRKPRAGSKSSSDTGANVIQSRRAGESCLPAWSSPGLASVQFASNVTHPTAPPSSEPASTFASSHSFCSVILDIFFALIKSQQTILLSHQHVSRSIALQSPGRTCVSPTPPLRFFPTVP